MIKALFITIFSIIFFIVICQIALFAVREYKPPLISLHKNQSEVKNKSYHNLSKIRLPGRVIYKKVLPGSCTSKQREWDWFGDIKVSCSIWSIILFQPNSVGKFYSKKQLEAMLPKGYTISMTPKGDEHFKDYLPTRSDNLTSGVGNLQNDSDFQPDPNRAIYGVLSNDYFFECSQKFMGKKCSVPDNIKITSSSIIKVEKINPQGGLEILTLPNNLREEYDKEKPKNRGWVDGN